MQNTYSKEAARLGLPGPARNYGSEALNNASETLSNIWNRVSGSAGMAGRAAKDFAKENPIKTTAAGGLAAGNYAIDKARNQGTETELDKETPGENEGDPSTMSGFAGRIAPYGAATIGALILLDQLNRKDPEKTKVSD